MVVLGTSVGGHHAVEVPACTKINAKIAQNFTRIRCMYTFAMAAQTLGNPAPGVGQFVWHCGTVVSQKDATSFRRHPDFNFIKNLKILVPSEVYENSGIRPKSFICTPTFARFSLPIQKFVYRRLQRLHMGTFGTFGHVWGLVGRYGGPWGAIGAYGDLWELFPDSGFLRLFHVGLLFPDPIVFSCFSSLGFRTPISIAPLPPRIKPMSPTSHILLHTLQTQLATRDIRLQISYIILL